MLLVYFCLPKADFTSNTLFIPVYAENPPQFNSIVQSLTS